MSYSFYLKNKLTGNVIDIAGASHTPGTALNAYPQKPNNSNQLRLEATLPLV